MAKTCISLAAQDVTAGVDASCPPSGSQPFIRVRLLIGTDRAGTADAA
jgi:hypothetical protein